MGPSGVRGSEGDAGRRRPSGSRGGAGGSQGNGVVEYGKGQGKVRM